MAIKLLSSNIINQISAGEVIDRPASVVKELVENSIDAGATQVIIHLERAGKNLISVIDNGKGMSRRDLEMSIMRHATSKLNEEDLSSIFTFGFRGEALPSIGSISKMTITSKTADEETGNSITILGGNQLDTLTASANEGTKVEIRDLFFATPARLKFLRSDAAELNQSLAIINRIALAHPNIGFKLYHEGKEKINFPARSITNTEKTDEELLTQRIKAVVGDEFIENSHEVDMEYESLRIKGVTSIPTYNRSNAEAQYLFVNNRPVKDKILNVAVRMAYQDYIASNRHAICVIFLEIDHQAVDVNVHPAKTEVRFDNPAKIRGLMISAIKNALMASSMRTSTTISAKAINFLEKSTSNNGWLEKNNYSLEEANKTNSRSFNLPQILHNASGATENRIEQKSFVNAFVPSSKPVENDNTNWNNASISINNNDTDAFVAVGVREEEFLLGAAKVQLYNTYIISQSNDKIFIIDQHAAHERLGYEKLKQQINDDDIVKQRLLVPEIIELADPAQAEMLDKVKVDLAKLGLDFDLFGEKSIIVSTYPSLLGDVNLRQLIRDIAENLQECEEVIALNKLIEHILETYACHYAIRAGRKMHIAEMNELLRQMETFPFSGQCNHGRPTYVTLNKGDIEKLFGRK